MNVLLIKDVDKLGKRGERVSVKPGYARNYLLPFQYAVLPTTSNEKRIAASRKAWLAEEAKIVSQAQALADLLKPAVVSIMEKASDEGRLYGSVNDKSIAARLGEMGFAKLDPRIVRLDQPIREVGDYDVRFHMHADVEVFVKVKVRADGFETWQPGQPLKRKAPGADAPTA